jgi:hypothetical protein
MKVLLYIGNSLLEMFETENVELKSEVSSISDITKNLTDFTRSFTVPASENNNILFKHYYNANIDNTFDARTKVSGRIELDGMPFKYGKFRLEKVSVKGGNPYAYTIQFWGNSVNLKDTIKNDELSALDLSAYNHTYNSANVKTGLESGLFSGDLVYSLFSKRQYYYNGNGADPVQTPTLSNIAFNSGGLTGVVWNDLKPSISLLPIIEAIETKYNLTFSRDFFGREEFNKLRLYLNAQAENNLNTFEQEIDFNGGDSTWVNLTNNTGTFSVYYSPIDFWSFKRFTHLLTVTPSLGSENTEYSVLTYVNDEVVATNKYIGNSTTTGSNSIFGITSGSQTYTVRYSVVSSEGFGYTASVENRQTVSMSIGSSITTNRTTTASANNIVGVFNASANLPKIKTMDFLRGLFQMFKLIVIAQDNGTIYVNTINDYYAEGKLIDLTDYVNANDYDVERGKLLNPINFKFQDPTTLLNTQFDNNTGQGYGDEELILEDEDGAQLDGESFEVALPFEQLVYERLLDITDNSNTNIMYAGVFDENIEGVNPKPHLFYNQNVSVGSKTVGFINDVGAKEELSTTINIPSHTLGFESPQFSTIFGKEFNEWDGNIINNTLYSNYYSNYITSVFNIKKRSFKYEANIPLRLQLKMGLNDVIQIENNYYRLENYTFNLLSGKTTLNLINSFDNTLNGFNADRTTITVNYQAQTESIYVTNGGNFSFNKIDVGFGTSWVTVTSTGNNVYFAFDQNLTGLLRVMQCEVQNTETLQTILVTLNQTDGKVITADNNVVTVDTDLITADNSI